MKKEFKIVTGLLGLFIIPVMVLGQTLTTTSEGETESRTTMDDSMTVTTTSTATSTTTTDRESEDNQNEEGRAGVITAEETSRERETVTRETEDNRTTDSQIDPTRTEEVRTGDAQTAEIRTTTNTTTRVESERTLATSPEQIQRPSEVRQRTDIQARESLVEIASSLQNLDQESRELEGQIKLVIEEGIDRAIVSSLEQTEGIQAFELQRVVDEPRNIAFNALENALRSSAPNDPAIVERVAETVNQSISNIENNLASFTEVSVDMSASAERISRLLEDFAIKVEQYQRLMRERDADLLFIDSDGDGLSDYEEIYIYNTDPFNAFTAGGELNDGEKVAAGIDPTSTTSERILFEDPRQTDESTIAEFYRVDNVQRIDDRIEFRGRALPNSFVTVYIFSTPVIVTVRTDERGEWTYILDKELEDGQHEVYVATVNNAGRIVARSQGNPFINTAEAATLGAFPSVGAMSDEGTGNFFQDNFILIIIAIVLIGIIITMSLFGAKPKNEIEVEEKHDSSSPPNLG